MNKSEHTYTLPTGITTVAKSMLDAIKDQKQITHVIIPQGVTSIDEKAFFHCSRLTSITIPDSVTSIGKQAFYFCTGLTSITIPDSVTRIEQSTFEYCSSLVSISLPDNIHTISKFAFKYCSNLTSINIPTNLHTICSEAFAGTLISKITIPPNVTNIERGAFRECLSLTSCDIPDNITTLSPYLFENCSKLEKIHLPQHITSIEEYAFANCSNLTYFTIPDSVTEIKPKAFQNWKRLKLIILPNDLKNKDINYWSNRGINKDKIQLIDSQTISIWAKDKKLSNTNSYHELALLYQLQNDNKFNPSWPDLGKLAPNLLMNDLLEVLPEEKINIVLPKTYKNLPINLCLENHSLFSVTPEKSRQEEKTDHLIKNGFKAYKNPENPTQTLQLREVSPAVSSAILKWLTIKEVATYLDAKATSEIKDTDCSKDRYLTTCQTRPVMQG